MNEYNLIQDSGLSLTEVKGPAGHLWSYALYWVLFLSVNVVTKMLLFSLFISFVSSVLFVFPLAASPAKALLHLATRKYLLAMKQIFSATELS